MATNPIVKLHPRPDRPSILVDELSGLEFTDYVRDMKPPYVQFSCEKFRKVICMCRAKRVGLVETPNGPVLKFVASLGELRAYFEASKKSFTPKEREDIGTFDECLPRMIAGWEALKESPQLLREGGRVELELIDGGNAFDSLTR